MSHFLALDTILGHQTGRQRERHAHVLCRLCEAKQDSFVEPMGGGSMDAPARTPRTRRTTTRKPSSDGGEDGDGDGAAPRYLLAASSHEGFVVEIPDGRRATLAVIDTDGNVIANDVARDAWSVAVHAYKAFLEGSGHLRIHAAAPTVAT